MTNNYNLLRHNRVSFPICLFFCRFHIHKSELNVGAGTVYRKYSKAFSDATDNLPIGIPTFCRAFPWHFVIGTCKNSFCFFNKQRIQIVDRKLELVQLGSGFMRLFGRLLKTSGTSVSTYFEFNRPRSLTLSFNEIVKRANTPFVLALKQHPDDKFFQANVSRSDTFLLSKRCSELFFNGVRFFLYFYIYSIYFQTKYMKTLSISQRVVMKWGLLIASRWLISPKISSTSISHIYDWY